MGQAQSSEATCEEQEQGNILDRTPTPTSLEVRGWSTVWREVHVGLNTEGFSGCDLH